MIDSRQGRDPPPRGDYVVSVTTKRERRQLRRAGLLPRPRELLSCSFCGKERKDVNRLVAGPDVYICDECVALCVEILETEEEPESSNDEGA